MKPWEQVFKWIGIVAVVFLAVFLVYEYARTSSYEAGLKNFADVASKIDLKNPDALTPAQTKDLNDAASKIGKEPLVSIGSNTSKANSDPGVCRVVKKAIRGTNWDNSESNRQGLYWIGVGLIYGCY